MAKLKKKDGPGRPPKEFTAEQIKQIDKYALHNCKDNQIAVALGIDGETFKTHFKERCQQKRAEGQAIKLEQQFNNKTPTMLIWWGKQHLGQSDKQELTGADGKPLVPKIIIFAQKEEPKKSDNS